MGVLEQGDGKFRAITKANFSQAERWLSTIHDLNCPLSIPSAGVRGVLHVGCHSLCRFIGKTKVFTCLRNNFKPIECIDTPLIRGCLLYGNAFGLETSVFIDYKGRER